MDEDFGEHVSELRTRISEEILKFMAEKCEFYEENVKNKRSGWCEWKEKIVQ